MKTLTWKQCLMGKTVLKSKKESVFLGLLSTLLEGLICVSNEQNRDKSAFDIWCKIRCQVARSVCFSLYKTKNMAKWVEFMPIKLAK